MAVTNLTSRLVPIIQGRKNLLVNGNCNVRQRGPNGITLAGGGVSGFGPVDRWKGTSGTGQSLFLAYAGINTGTLLGTYNGLYVAQTGTTSVAATVEQRVDDLAAVDGQVVTLSFWANNPGGNVTWSVGVNQFFGVGGGPSSPVVGATQSFTVTAVLTKFTFTFTVAAIAGKTLGTNFAFPSYFSVVFTAPTVTFATAFYQHQLEYGYSATSFDFRPFKTDLADCQRYYAKTYDAGTVNFAGVPEATVTPAPALKAAATGVVIGSLLFHWRYPVAMVFPPTTIFIYSENGTVGNASVVGTPATTVPVAILDRGDSGLSIQNSSNAVTVAGTWYECHVAAISEI